MLRIRHVPLFGRKASNHVQRLVQHLVLAQVLEAKPHSVNLYQVAGDIAPHLDAPTLLHLAVLKKDEQLLQIALQLVRASSLRLYS